MGNNKNTNEIIDVSQIIELIRRNWWMFAVSLVLCGILGLTYLYVKHSVYSIHAKVLVVYDDGSNLMGSSIMQSLSLGGVGGSTVEDEVLVMGAHSIKSQTIKELKLNRMYYSPNGLLKKRYYYNDSPIEILAPEELFDTLTVGLKFNIEANADLSEIEVSVKKGRFETLAKVTSDKLPMVVNTPYGIYSVDTTKYYVPGDELDVTAVITGNSVYAEEISKDLSVQKSDRKANGISLYYEDINIERGKDLLNKMIELYNRRGQKEKDEMAINTGKFIDERLDTLYISLAESENKIQQYKQSKNIVDVSSEASYQFGKKSTLEVQILAAETELEIIKITQLFLADPENAYSLIATSPGSASVQSAISTYNSLVMQLMDLKRTAKGDNLTLQTLMQRIDVVRENINKSLNNTYETSLKRLNDKKEQLAQVCGRLDNIPQQEREYLELQRDQSIKNQLYSFLLQKREENQLVLAATTPKGKIIDEAFAFNRPLSPNKLMVIAVALFFGLAIPALYLYVKSLLSNKFDSIDALSRLTTLPIIGEICHSRGAKDEPIVVSETSTRPIAELFRLLRSNLHFVIPVNSLSEGQVAIVTSSCSGEGKTFVSMNVAESLALMDKKVVLVGLDIRLPMLAQNLGLPSTPGVTTYLSGAISDVDKLIQHHRNCDIIVAGPVPPNPSELLLSGRIDQLINELKQRYDYVIIDSAPIGLVSDTFSLAKFSDIVLYVTRANYTKKSFIKYLNTVVERGQLKNVAVVVNDTNPKLSHGYGYGYGSKDE